ncbi:MAG: ABC transporter permease subunit [Thermodesulfovibrionales bacterium]
MKALWNIVLYTLLLLFTSHSYASTLQDIKARGYLLWGSDAEGGAPYVFPDPDDPSKLIGFEVEIVEAISKELGVRHKMIQNSWDSLIPGLERGDYDIAINGIEITPDRARRILFSIPYYVYTEQLVVRADNKEINSLSDLKGKKVGTLSGAVCHRMLEEIGGIKIVVYSGVVEPYEDLALGRLDAVFLDLPIAAYYARPDRRLRYAGEPAGEGFYGIAIRRQDRELKEAIDNALRKLIKEGELKRIYEKWNLWNEKQEKLYVMAEESYAELEKLKEAPLKRFIPNLLKGAGLTIFISVISMVLAMLLGLILTIMRLYGRPPLSTLAIAYIEVYRGTPLLIQLYILYYGLPNIGISLSPLMAAFLGLGMNYAAYEAELYRAGINAVSKGQMEAALSLGMTQGLALKRIILPQAFRIALPGITNDFIALFKDSSLVSVIAMVELTKTYTILAANTLRFFELGLVVAILYFGMSYPLSILARRLEQRLKGRRWSS